MSLKLIVSPPRSPAMNSSYSTNLENPQATTHETKASSPWHRLSDKRVLFFTLPLLIAATIVEFVILATGYTYQKTVSVPQGMGVTFLGIGPIGATILAVECLKLPLAIWASSRVGFQKLFMLCAGLPLICLLTFQLVKDMAVYEMGVAMAPAAEMLEKASAEEIRIAQLKGELEAIEQKKDDRELALAQLDARHAKTKGDLEEALAHNEATREEANTLTEYQKTELNEVEARQAAIIKQADADAAQINEALAELRAQREVEVGRSSVWNAEEARIENAHKLAMAAYTNQMAAYEKDKERYENANFLKRKVMKKPVDPGVPPVRETNTILKPTALEEIDAQIEAKMTELADVNAQRRARVAQVAADARVLREQFEGRSSTQREDTDRKREELLGALALAADEWKADREQIDQEVATSVQRVDGIREEIDASRERAEGFYEAREAAIRETQVHRIATTVEIVRGMLFGERPMSITATSKERGDVLTDQISMVRIWVYPALAFIVAFLPMLMVEVGCTSLFKPESQRTRRRGLLNRSFFELYRRAVRQEICRAERMTAEATNQLAARNRELTEAKAEAAELLKEKDSEAQKAREAMAEVTADCEERLKRKEEDRVAKCADLEESLNRATAEIDELRYLQTAEVERQVQLRQSAWSERLAKINQGWDEQLAAKEAERTALIQAHDEKLLALTAEYKAQVTDARRQLTEAEQTAKETSAKWSQELKESVQAHEAAEARLKHQADSFELQLERVKENSAREVEAAIRQEKQRLERQYAELEKSLRHRDEDFDHQLKQREQELTFEFEKRLADQKADAEEEARQRESDVERRLEVRSREVAARWKQELQQKEESFQVRLKQQQLRILSQAELNLSDALAQAEEDFRDREEELKRDLEVQSRDVEARFRGELQQKELAFHVQLKQSEQEWRDKADSRESQMRNQWAADLKTREQEWEREMVSRVSAVAARLDQDIQQKEEGFQKKLAQREKELQSQFNARRVELQDQAEQDVRRRDLEIEELRGAIAPLKAQLSRIEKERDEAKLSAFEGTRQVKDLRGKLMDLSSSLNGRSNGEEIDEDWIRNNGV